jgi:hypothetical protein
MLKARISCFVAATILAAAATLPTSEADALTKRIHHAQCKRASGSSTPYFYAEDGWYASHLGGGGSVYCPVTEEGSFQKGSVTEARVYYQSDTVSSSTAIMAKACITRAAPSSPTSSATCSTATTVNPTSTLYTSFTLGSLFPAYPNDFGYIYVTLDPGQATNDNIRFRGLRFTY